MAALRLNTVFFEQRFLLPHPPKMHVLGDAGEFHPKDVSGASHSLKSNSRRPRLPEREVRLQTTTGSFHSKSPISRTPALKRERAGERTKSRKLKNAK